MIIKFKCEIANGYFDNYWWPFSIIMTGLFQMILGGLFDENTHPDRISAKLAIAAELGKPLAKLTKEQQDCINQTVNDSLNKRQIFDQVHAYFNPTSIGGQHAQ